MNAGDVRSALFGRLVLWLFDQEQAEAAGYGAQENALRARVAVDFTPIGDVALESFLRQHPSSGNLAEWHSFLYMPTVYDGAHWLPILTFRYDLPNDELRLRVAMFRLLDNDAPEPTLCAMGYRFETPEDGVPDAESTAGAGDEEPGIHAFYHAQPIKTLDPEVARRQLPTPQWFADQQPSFPLDADNYLQLFVAMLVIVYGRRFVLRLRTNSDLLRMLTTDLRAMRCLRGGSLLAERG